MDSIDPLEKLELDLLFEAIYRRYGYDFRNYAYDSIRRRVLQHLNANKIETIAELQHRILHDEYQADKLVASFSINVTEMFRDPHFFREIRDSIIPTIAQEDHIKIWHAGCSSGEEVYSMAILLHEMKLLDKCQIYATDFNHDILKQASLGHLDFKNMRTHIKNYLCSGGTEEFANYYHTTNEHAVINNFIKDKITFSHHNLAIDSSFSKVHIIICRNVLIYFNRSLQEHTFHTFNNSLSNGGILCLGSHETLRLSEIYSNFNVKSEKLKIYQKKYQHENR